MSAAVKACERVVARAAMEVVDAARDVVHGAQPQSSASGAGYCVPGPDMDALAKAVRGFTEAADLMLKTIAKEAAERRESEMKLEDLKKLQRSIEEQREILSVASALDTRKCERAAEAIEAVIRVPDLLMPDVFARVREWARYLRAPEEWATAELGNSYATGLRDDLRIVSWSIEGAISRAGS